MTGPSLLGGSGELRDGPVLDAVRSFLAAGHVPPSAALVVACSGGADSLALAAAVHAAAGEHPLVLATVDHGLQPGSAEVAREVAEVARAIGYARVEILPVRVTGPGGTEAAARTARYTALRGLASSLGPQTAVLLAHTADDQAETVLLGLARGSGPRSIAGMRPWRAPWGRPLLAVRRTDAEAACAAAGLAPWQDPQNADPSFTRVRLRREVLPQLEQVLGGGVASALARTAELMADDLAALDELAERALVTTERTVPANGSGAGPGPEIGAGSTGADPGSQIGAGSTGAGPGSEIGAGSAGAGPALDRAALAAWPAAVRRRALRLWVARRVGVTELTYQHLVRLDGLVTVGRSGSAVRLPGGIDVTRHGDRLVLAPKPPAP